MDECFLFPEGAESTDVIGGMRRRQGVLGQSGEGLVLGQRVRAGGEHFGLQQAALHHFVLARRLLREAVVHAQTLTQRLLLHHDLTFDLGGLGQTVQLLVFERSS